MAMTDYIEERYDDTFESVYTVLSDLARRDPSATIRHIRQTLKSLYIRQGNDWTGRGAIGNAGLDASVAAHEAVLAELTVNEPGGKA
ncbi:hypothetical protein [Trichlorobacter lovleyi]|uniref:Uncharacterized protein n=1 Tax=Trichlorobacter lovleyi (strain ATCC BAA-1151 / DSM 17278 / SZ) TaxID=398767 RepID=B3E870_TRIL1|nr:hypothetical protein [Trichlorobacter lovleyi]ACD95107.1 conserved hypothetical protein [Trichlorobacter lovleyi SZ]